MNNEARRNLTVHETVRITLEQRKEPIAEQAKERQIRKPADFVPQNSAEQKGKETREIIAEIAGVSRDTVDKVEKIEKAAPIPVRDASRKGEISINSAYQVTKMEPEQQKEIAHRIENIEKEPKETNTPKKIVQEVAKRPHVAYNSGNNEWYTPYTIIQAARETMGNIDLDPASCEIANETVKADKYYTYEDNGLQQEWYGNVWLNPPYASDMIGKFVDKTVSERRNYNQAIVLVNNATETGWFLKLVSVASAICFPYSRVKYYMPDGKTGAPLQGQAIIYIGNDPDIFSEEFESIGWIARDIYGIYE